MRRPQSQCVNTFSVLRKNAKCRLAHKFAHYAFGMSNRIVNEKRREQVNKKWCRWSYFEIYNCDKECQEHKHKHTFRFFSRSATANSRNARTARHLWLSVMHPGRCPRRRLLASFYANPHAVYTHNRAPHAVSIVSLHRHCVRTQTSKIVYVCFLTFGIKRTGSLAAGLICSVPSTRSAVRCALFLQTEHNHITRRISLSGKRHRTQVPFICTRDVHRRHGHRKSVMRSASATFSLPLSASNDVLCRGPVFLSVALLLLTVAVRLTVQLSASSTQQQRGGDEICETLPSEIHLIKGS